MLLDFFLTSLSRVLGHVENTAVAELVFMSDKNDYQACTFMLGDQKVVYREAKVTPKKIGLFVAIWKRNDLGETTPHCLEDDFDYLMIGTNMDTEKGYFLYEKAVLGQLGIVSTKTKEGKRGMRVYPMLEKEMNNQALRTYHLHRPFYFKI